MNAPSIHELARASEPPEDDPGGDDLGLSCKTCGCHHLRVVYTRQQRGGRIMRRRECRHCGRRLTTYESAPTAT